MTTKQSAFAYCMQKLEEMQLAEIFDETEFNRCFKGCNLLNPFSVGLRIADKLIFNHHYKITQNERSN